MRLLAAAFAVLFGAGVVWAQSTGQENPGPRMIGPAKPAAKQDKGTKAAPAKQAAPKSTKAPKSTTPKSATPKSTKSPAVPKSDAKTQAAPKPAPKAPTAKRAEKKTPGAKAIVPRAAAPADSDKGAVAKSVRDSYAAFSLAERIALQSDLVWTGDYNGLINGEFSDRLVAAVKAFQTRNNTKPTGVLNPQERAILSDSAKPLRDEVGWRLVTDTVTGAHLGLPLKFATQSTALRNGTRWSSAQGQLQIETFSVSDTTLEAVFERQKKQPPARRVGYNVLRSDFFVISGTQGLRKFYVRGAIKDGDVRGVTVLYDQAMEGTMDPVVVAMSSAFNPFPPDGVAADGTAMRRRVEYGTGLVVSNAGHILTDQQLVDDCKVIVVPGLGSAERVAEDKAGDLALIRVYGARNLKPIALIGDRPTGDTAAIVGIADPQQQAGDDKVTVVAAKLGTASDARPLEPAPGFGFSGAAALDANGRMMGVVVLKSTVVTGPTPAPRAALVPRERLVNFLEANFVAPASGVPGVEPARAAVVRVICVRK